MRERNDIQRDRERNEKKRDKERNEKKRATSASKSPAERNETE
jgi:hypothetical protein